MASFSAAAAKAWANATSSSNSNPNSTTSSSLGKSPPLAKATPNASVVKDVLSLPPHWVSQYNEFISKNAGQVSQIESALRSLTYIIPGRFRDAEIASETLHSGVQLLSLYHDAILQRASSSPPSSSSSSPLSSPTSSQSLPPLPHRTMHARYTAYWSQKSPLYRRVALALQVAQYTQLLIEMAAKRRGKGNDRLRWRVVVLVEAFKALCKLILLRITRARPLVTPALPERVPVPPEEYQDEETIGSGKGVEEFHIPEEFRDDDEKMAKEAEAAWLGQNETENENGVGATTQNGHVRRTPAAKQLPPTLNGNVNGKATTTGSSSTASSSGTSPTHAKDWHMPRTNSTLPSLPSNSDISSYLLSRVLTADDIKPAPRLLHPLTGAAHAAEVLHIIAPLVYAMALAHFSLRYSPNSDIASRRGKKPGIAASWAPWVLGLAMTLAARRLRDRGLRTTALEREEWSRRGWALGWWAMRGAAYEHVVKGVVAGVRRRVPSFVGGILEDYEYLWENYYFSTAD